MQQSTRRALTFNKAPQVAMTMDDTLLEYTGDPRWVPVDDYTKEERPMNMERGMLVEKGRVVMRVFCP